MQVRSNTWSWWHVNTHPHTCTIFIYTYPHICTCFTKMILWRRQILCMYFFSFNKDISQLLATWSPPPLSLFIVFKILLYGDFISSPLTCWNHKKNNVVDLQVGGGSWFSGVLVKFMDKITQWILNFTRGYSSFSNSTKFWHTPRT